MEKVTKLLTFIFIMAMFFSACQKEQLKEITTTTHKELYVQNGILVFNSEESFDETIEKVNRMGDSERKIWEENLGFKSFDRFVSEIQDTQIAYQEKFAHLTKEELEKGLESGEIDRFSPLTKEYLDKGIIKIVFDENKEEYLDINYPMYSSLVNIDGFVAVGNEILQYTENKFKLIKSLDFSKLEKLNNIKDNINDETFFVTGIHGREKVTFGEIFKYSAESFTNKREKVVATETYQYYDRHYDGINYEANYSLKVENKKKYWRPFKWDWSPDYADTWVWVDFDIEAKEMPNGKDNVNISYGKLSFSTHIYTLIKRNFSKFYYLNSPNGGPTILNSKLNIQRWGGAHGLGIRLINHVRYERF